MTKDNYDVILRAVEQWTRRSRPEGYRFARLAYVLLRTRVWNYPTTEVEEESWNRCD